jgi:NTP pyrophosphatase (non-canonical NTP hydrolase)
MVIRRDMEDGASLREWQGVVSEWAKAYYSDKEKKPAFLLAHLMEEAAEVWKAWREGADEEIKLVTKHGVTLEKPEGIGAELADVIGMALIAADFLGIDLESDMIRKFDYLQDRLAAKKSRAKGKGKHK